MIGWRLAVLAVWLTVPLARGAGLSVRGAEHDGFSRLVIEAGGLSQATIRQDGSVATVTFNDPDPAAALLTPRLRNLVKGERQPGRLILTLRPGVLAHGFVLDSRLVIDLIAPARSAATLMVLPRRTIAAAAPSRFENLDLAPVSEVVQPGGADATAVARSDGPAPTRPQRPALQPEIAGPAATLAFPLAATTGAAAFHRGDQVVIVFDERRVIDEATLRAERGFDTARVQLLPQAVMLMLSPAPGTDVALTREGPAWSITIGRPGIVAPGLPAEVAAGRLGLPTASAGRVVAIPDQRTGDSLLVGTSRTAGPHIGGMRRFAQFTLLPTILGVVVDPLDDHVVVRADSGGYSVSAGPPGAALALLPNGDEEKLAQGSGLSREYDLPNQPALTLIHRLQTQIADAAASPPRERLSFRRAVAQTLLALGLGPEAQGVMAIATADDPRALTDPASQSVAAAAALIAGRPSEADGLDVTGASETDEHRLWRRLRGAALLAEGARPETGMTQDIAATADLLLLYPPTLRRDLLGLTVDTLMRGGAMEAASHLLDALPDEPGLGLARAARLQAEGRTEAALAAFDRLGQDRDRSVRARALVAALDLRTNTGRLSAGAAADAGERLFDAWRGDARERDLRLRVARWQGEAGRFRAQLETLHETALLFPAAGDGVHEKLATAFAALLNRQGGAALDQIPPLDLVALVQENADLIPQGATGEFLAGKLADRLKALDLPRQEAGVLDGLMARVAPAGRAALGARLAALDLQEGHPAAAHAVLARSDADAATLTPGLGEHRRMLGAQADAALGNRPAALAGLAPLSDPGAIRLRAALDEDGHDWKAAGVDLASLAGSLPAAGMLSDDQSALLLRWASALAQADDEAGLARLRARFGGRLQAPDDAALFAVLTEAPIREVSDLGRAATEIKAARQARPGGP